MKNKFTVALVLNVFLTLFLENYCHGNEYLKFALDKKSYPFERVDKEYVVEYSNKNNDHRAVYEGLFSSDEMESDVYDKSNSIHLKSKKGASSLAYSEDDNETEYYPGEKISLKAEANPGYRFLNWTINGKEVSRALKYEVVMTSKDLVIQANFVIEPSLPSVPSLPSLPSKPSKPEVAEPGTGLLGGLMAFYEMDSNVSGALRDSHGENHGKNSEIGDVPGFTEKGNKYDGEASISSVPHSNSLNLDTEFTLMADIFLNGNGQGEGSVIVGKTFSSSWPENQTYSLAITKDNKVRIRANIPYLMDWVSTQTVPAGKWVRIIATYKSGEGFSLYLDKVTPEKSPSFSGAIRESEMELTVGSASLQRNAANTRRIEGVLDNVGIWNRQLSKDEISGLIYNKITYPDFTGNQAFRVSVSTTVDEVHSNSIDEINSTKAEVGEKLIFLAEEEENVVFDHWSVDGEKVSDLAIFELDMPGKDVTLTKHVRTFVDPKISVALPNRNSVVEAFSDIHVEFEIENNDAEIERIELFDKEELVGEITKDFLSGFDWKNVPQGDHQLTAVATDTRGKTHFSDPVVLKSIKTQSLDASNVLLAYVIGPNPTADYLNVIFTNLDGVYDFEIRVVSMNGVVQKTFTARPEESKVIVDVSDLTNGVYVLHLTANGYDISSKKFIKE